MQGVSITDKLKNTMPFSRNEFAEEMKTVYGLSAEQSKYDLQKKLDSGEIIRIGWNQYTVADRKKLYSHDYSDESKAAAKKIGENYIDVNFQIFELVQLNQFINHLISHNTIFVGVENELIDYVFDTLNKEYPGKVMLKPSLDMYYRYYQDGEIVVVRLPSEAPKGLKEPWQSRLEKILVDVLTDKIIGGIVPEEEKAAIVEGAYRDYLVDERTMMRYAKRKGAERKVANVLKEYGRVMQL